MIFCVRPRNFYWNWTYVQYTCDSTHLYEKQSFIGFKKRPSTPNFNSIGRKMKVWKQFHLHHYVTYALFCTNFNETHNCSTTIHEDLLYRISSETAKQYRNWVKSSFMQAGKIWLILSRFWRRSHSHSNISCQTSILNLIKIRQTVAIVADAKSWSDVVSKKAFFFVTS
jgi:hypothetical protein